MLEAESLLGPPQALVCTSLHIVPQFPHQPLIPSPGVHSWNQSRPHLLPGTHDWLLIIQSTPGLAVLPCH